MVGVQLCFVFLHIPSVAELASTARLRAGVRLNLFVNIPL